LGEERGNNEREKKLGHRKIYIDNLTQEERGVQRKLKEIARGERADGRRARVEYRRIEIEDQIYVWNEEEERMVKRKNFRRAAEEEA